MRGWLPVLAANRVGSIPSETIDGAAHAERTAIEDVRVHHRRAHVGMVQQLLHGPNVVAILEQMCRERMPEGVWPDTFDDAGLSRRLCDSLLDNGLVEVKPGRRFPRGLDADARRRGG